MQIMFLYDVIVIFSLSVFVLVNSTDITCAKTNNGRLCFGGINHTLTPYHQALADDGRLLVVGTKNFLHYFKTDTLSRSQTVDVTPDDASVADCYEAHSSRAFCDNSITLVEQIPQSLLEGNATLKARYNNTVMVCGTNAFRPHCTVHSLTNISESFDLSDDSAKLDVGFSPYTTKWSNNGMLSSTGAFYAATNVDDQQTRTSFSVSPDPLSRDTSFAAATNDRDPFWVSETEFVSIHELDTHIYLFGLEDSNEVTNAPLVKFARVIRVCKSDRGIEDDTNRPIPRFKTFQKIRVTCPNFEGNDLIPKFFYDKIQSTFVHEALDGSKWLYATFVSQLNAPVGTAICKYSFDPEKVNSLENVFSTTASYYDSNNNDFKQVEEFEPFGCPGEATGRERTREESTRYQLIQGVVLPSGGKATHTQNGVQYTHICVDVYVFGGSTYEIMFVTTNHMTVEAICYKDGVFDRIHVLANYSATITSLLLDNTNTTRRLYVGGENLVANIILDDCQKHTNCLECLESANPYCAWSNNSMSCINKLTYSDSNAIGVLEIGGGDSINDCPRRAISISSSSSTTITPTTTTRSEVPVAMTTSSVTTTNSNMQCPAQTSTIITEYTSSTVTVTINITQSKAIMPTATGVQDSVHVPTVSEIGQLIGVGVAGLIVGVVVGLLLCLVAVSFRSKVSRKPMLQQQVYGNGHVATSTGALGSSLGNGVGSRDNVRTEQYTIAVSLPEKNEDEFKDNLSPLPPSISPPVVDDSEMEDDVISDLPPTSGPPSQSSSNNRLKKWSIPKGRTPSTRWLRASESSYADSESPVSPY